MKKICLLILSLCCLVVLAGCSPQNAATQKGSGSAYAVLTDDLGRQVTDFGWRPQFGQA